MPIDNIVWDEPKDIVWDTPKQSALDRLKTKSTYGDFARTLNDSLKAASGATSGQSQLGRGLQDVLDSAALGSAWVRDKLGGQGNYDAVKSDIDAINANYKEAVPNSAGMRLASNVGATLPVGGVLGKGAEALGGGSALVNALRSGGMSTGGANLGRAADLALRTGAAGLVGTAGGAMIDPENALQSGAISSAMPATFKAAGLAGQAIGAKSAEKYNEALNKFNREAPKRETLKEAVDAGYVVPPNIVNPSAKNALIESFSGKQATSQIASVKNQDVTEKLVRQSLGLAEDAPLTKGALEQIRKVEGGAYKKVSELSENAAADLELLKQTRNDAQGWFNAYNRSASPEDLAKAKGFRDAAEALELKLEGYAKEAGKDELVPALREARKQIAKTYTVERALNDATGSVNPKVFGRLYEKNKPLSDGLDVVGKFASGYPQVNQSIQQMGSPAAHNLRSMGSLLFGGGGMAALGPAGVAAAAVPFLAPMASRGMMFRRGAQEALANPAAPTNANARIMNALLQNPQAQEAIARSAPLAITSMQNR